MSINERREVFIDEFSIDLIQSQKDFENWEKFLEHLETKKRELLAICEHKHCYADRTEFKIFIHRDDYDDETVRLKALLYRKENDEEFGKRMAKLSNVDQLNRESLSARIEALKKQVEEGEKQLAAMTVASIDIANKK